MIKTLTLALALAVMSAGQLFAQPAIFVVRHAERADGGAASGQMTASPDPDLSDAGRARAESLATILKDAGVKVIYATEFKRTRQTAEPLARALGIEVTIVSSRDTASLLEKLRGATENVLVVGHSNTVPDIVKGLGVTTPVSVADDEYDNLFVVTPAAPQRYFRLHYR